jgi:hypothetical protein
MMPPSTDFALGTSSSLVTPWPAAFTLCPANSFLKAMVVVKDFFLTAIFRPSCLGKVAEQHSLPASASLHVSGAFHGVRCYEGLHEGMLWPHTPKARTYELNCFSAKFYL